MKINPDELDTLAWLLDDIVELSKQYTVHDMEESLMKIHAHAYAMKAIVEKVNA